MNTLSGRHNTLVLVSLCFLSLVVAAWGYLLWNPASPKTPPAAVREKLTLHAPIIGGTDPERLPGGKAGGSRIADITVVEFGDYLCPSCADIHKSMQKIMAANPRVRFIWKDMPNTRLNPLAKGAAIAARCAGAQGKYWEYHDLLFTRQDEIVDANAFTQLADELKLNESAFESCAASPVTAQMVDLTVAEGVALGVDATPYFFIGKARGAFDEGDIKAAIRQAELSDTP